MLLFSSVPTAAAVNTTLATPKLSAPANTESGVRITWGAVKGAAKYRVFIRNGSAWKKLGDTAGRWFLHKNAVSGTKYRYTVRCLSADGKRYTSGYNTTGVQIVCVAAPQLRESQDLPNGVRLSWNAVKGASKYRVYVKNGTSWKKLADTAAASYVHAGTVPGVEYTYTLRCLNAAGTTVSGYCTAGFTHRYEIPAVLETPRITGCENTANAAVIRWDPTEGAERYRVLIRSGDRWTTLGETDKTYLRYADVSSGESFTCTVCCISPDGKSYLSRFDEEGSSFTYVAMPQIQWVINTVRGPMLQWNSCEGASAYRVYIRSDGVWIPLADTKEITFIDTDAPEKAPRTFSVCCLDENGDPVSTYLTAGKTIYATRENANIVFTKGDFAARMTEILGREAALEEDPDTPLTRQNASHMLVGALGYAYHREIALSDSADMSLATAVYYGYFQPDDSGCIQPHSLITVEEYDRLLEELGRYAKLCGKRVLAFGDSIMVGVGNKGAGISRMTAEKYGMEQICYAVSGSTFGICNQKPHITDAIRSAYRAGHTADLILLNGGTNDMYLVGAGRTQDRFDPLRPEESTFASGMEYALMLIRHYWGGVPVLYVRAHNMDICDDALERQIGEYGLALAEEWEACTADVYSDTGFNTEDPDIRDRCTRYVYDSGTHDGIHPTALGYAVYYLPLVGERIASLFS